MDWQKEGHRWPNRHLSRFVSLSGNSWHIQQMGSGPVLLLLHGTGATTHSYAEMIPALAKRFCVVALDLPGHGFTSKLYQQRPNLPNIAIAIASLLHNENLMPDYVVGHSAGAAIAVQMAATRAIQPRALVAINGAFFPFDGFSGQIFPAAAKLLLVNPFASHLFALSAANRSRVEALMASTGSQLSHQGLDCYHQALQSPHHVEGTLAMMANWDLNHMANMLQRLDIPVLQMIGAKDGTVAPALADRSHQLLQQGTKRVFEDCGHLAHEEQPKLFCSAIEEFITTSANQPASPESLSQCQH